MPVKNKPAPLGCSFSILGDSYSTFRGFIPEGYNCYYPQQEWVKDVLRVEDTWWHILMRRWNMRLLRNDSISGATVCTRVREEHTPDVAFTCRAEKFFSAANGEKPDCIFLFGGTNDSWLERPCGELQFSGWREEDLSCVLPAYCYILDLLKRENPDALTVAVINTDLEPALREGMIRAGQHYGAVNVVLEDIAKENGHPSALGMTQIAEQIRAALE